MNNPVYAILAISGAVGIVVLFLLYATGNFHCVNLPIFGTKCAIG